MQSKKLMRLQLNELQSFTFPLDAAENEYTFVPNHLRTTLQTVKNCQRTARGTREQKFCDQPLALHCRESKYFNGMINHLVESIIKTSLLAIPRRSYS